MGAAQEMAKKKKKKKNKKKFKKKKKKKKKKSKHEHLLKNLANKKRTLEKIIHLVH